MGSDAECHIFPRYVPIIRLGSMARGPMTDRERIAHLYRRFGLGASPAEVESGLQIGVEGTIGRLIEIPPKFEFPIEPYEFVWYADADPDLAGEYFRRWWLLRMLVTPDPLAARMEVFWHSHFAVSNQKVEFGPMMLDYLLAIQANSLGSFRSLLGAVVKTPAMLEYLDMGRSMRGHPNENLGRELMELYTLGEGNYTETDVKEAARALTGWGYLNTFFDLPGTNAIRTLDALRDQRPFAAFAWLPALHDDGEKTILGTKARHTGEDLLDLLAARPETARHLARKLWAHFAYPDPEDGVVDAIAKAFTDSNGNIRKTVAAIARHDAFWSEKAVRRRIKSPVEYTVPMLRALNLGGALMAFRAKPATSGRPLNPVIQNSLFTALESIDAQGQSLLRPPNPSGWKDGSDWAHSATMTARMTMQIPFVTPFPGQNATLLTALAFVKEAKPRTGPEVLARIALLFDWSLSEASLAVLNKVWEGKPSAYLAYLPEFHARFQKTLHLAAAATETHFC